MIRQICLYWFVLLALAGFVRPEKVTADQPPQRFNVLMIVVDDMNDWVGCLGGHPQAHTPNIDRLAARGVLFTNAHCTAPVCNPSRVSTLTGVRPSTTGIYDNRVRWHEALPDLISIPQHFRNHGYLTAGGGKIYHHMPGFDRLSDWSLRFDQVFDGPYQDQLSRGLDVSDFHWPAGFPLNRLDAVRTLAKPPKNPREFDWGPIARADSDTGDGRMVTWAEEFLSSPPDQPFLLTCGIYRPHLPFYAPGKYFDLFDPQTLTLPPIQSADCDDLPVMGQKFANGRRDDLLLVMQEGRYRELLHSYLASIAFADAMIGRLLDALDASPAAQSTIVVLWSDHGWHFGEKMALHKFTLWERATHVPFIISLSPDQRGSRCDRAVDLVNLFPTLNELCSLPRVEANEGLSLVPLLKDPAITWNAPAITTFGAGNHSVRTDRYRYISYSDGGEELYDHENDPHEWKNLAGQDLTQPLRDSLRRWLPHNDAAPPERTRPGN